ncbi:saccharopine dehydrogenase domain protein [Pseudomonas aeruginosa]|nr:saccharopine dehydrogenase domain protein [Pseudomonas aeruginosa]
MYDLTLHGVLLAVRHLLDYQGPGGYFTPSRLLGARCVELLPGSGRITVIG